MFCLVSRNSLTIKDLLLGSVIFRNDMLFISHLFLFFFEHGFEHDFEHDFEHGFEHGFEHDFENDFDHDFEHGFEHGFEVDIKSEKLSNFD